MCCAFTVAFMKCLCLVYLSICRKILLQCVFSVILILHSYSILVSKQEFIRHLIICFKLCFSVKDQNSEDISKI